MEYPTPFACVVDISQTKASRLLLVVPTVHALFGMDEQGHCRLMQFWPHGRI